MIYHMANFAGKKNEKGNRFLDIASKTAIGAGAGASISAGITGGGTAYAVSKMQRYGKGTNYKQPLYNMEGLRNQIEGTYYEKNPGNIYINRPDKEFRKVVRKKMKKSIRKNLVDSFKKSALIGAGIGALGLGAYQLGKTNKS